MDICGGGSLARSRSLVLCTRRAERGQGSTDFDRAPFGLSMHPSGRACEHCVFCSRLYSLPNHGGAAKQVDSTIELLCARFLAHQPTDYAGRKGMDERIFAGFGMSFSRGCLVGLLVRSLIF